MLYALLEYVLFPLKWSYTSVKYFFPGSLQIKRDDFRAFSRKYGLFQRYMSEPEVTSGQFIITKILNKPGNRIKNL